MGCGESKPEKDHTVPGKIGPRQQQKKKKKAKKCKKGSDNDTD
jgi:hypothetical protein